MIPKGPKEARSKDRPRLSFAWSTKKTEHYPELKLGFWQGWSGGHKTNRKEYIMRDTKRECTLAITGWVGIDVAKATFDVAYALEGQKASRATMAGLPQRSFERTRTGVEAFLAWLDTQVPLAHRNQVRVVMEATGKYSIELAVWLLEQRPCLAPAIVNPKLTNKFIGSLGLRTRTDAVVARALAFYGVDRAPHPYNKPKPQQQELRELVRYRRFLVEQNTAERNRCEEHSTSAFVRKQHAKRITAIGRDIARVEREMRLLVKKNPAFNTDVELLTSIFGVGFIVATVVLAELGDLRRFMRARELSAFAGLSPIHTESGTSVKTRTHLCKQGHPGVRQALYLASLSAIRQDNHFSRTYHRLLASGKKKMVALGAVMRKILVVMRAILISGQAYDPMWKTQ